MPLLLHVLGVNRQLFLPSTIVNNRNYNTIILDIITVTYSPSAYLPDPKPFLEPFLHEAPPQLTECDDQGRNFEDSVRIEGTSPPIHYH